MNSCPTQTQRLILPEKSLLANLRGDYFSTPSRTAVTAICLAVIGWLAWTLFQWAIVGAVWDRGAGACRGATGACWAVITARHRLILFGLYPYEKQWRSAIACLAILLTVVVSCLPLAWSPKRLPLIWITGYGAFYILMRGGVFGLPIVLETQWGGLALTGSDPFR